MFDQPLDLSVADEYLSSGKSSTKIAGEEVVTPTLATPAP
jgi:hypothetical protein